MEQLFLLLVRIFYMQLSEIQQLHCKGYNCDYCPYYVLDRVSLGEDEDDVHVDCEKVGVNSEKVKLNLAVKHFASVVEVQVILVLSVVKEQAHKNKDKNHGSVEGEESDERPEFVEDDHFELKWKARKLYFLMKQFLAARRFIFIFDVGLIAFPAAEEEIYGCKYDLSDNCGDGLIAHEVEDGSSDLIEEV